MNVTVLEDEVFANTCPEATWFDWVSTNLYTSPFTQDWFPVKVKVTSLRVSHNSAEALKDGKSNSVYLFKSFPYLLFVM